MTADKQHYGDSIPDDNQKSRLLDQCVPKGAHSKERRLWAEYISATGNVPTDGGKDDPWVYAPDGSQLWRKLDHQGEPVA